jgi:hypothetical protein
MGFAIDLDFVNGPLTNPYQQRPYPVQDAFSWHGREGTVHGFRASLKTWCGDCTNFPNECVEAALHHTIGNKAEQSYQQGSFYPKRANLMQAWSDFFPSIKFF